jgi:hypothetical protein
MYCSLLQNIIEAQPPFEFAKEFDENLLAKNPILILLRGSACKGRGLSPSYSSPPPGLGLSLR